MMRRGIKIEENRDEARKNWKDDGRRIVEFFCLGRGGRWRGEGFENAISYQDLSLGGSRDRIYMVQFEGEDSRQERTFSSPGSSTYHSSLTGTSAGSAFKERIRTNCK